MAYYSIATSNYDERFKKTERIHFRGSHIELWDLRPHNERSDSVPVLFIPAWGASPRPYKNGLKIHYVAGRRVIAIAFSPKAQELKIVGIPDALATKVHAVLTALDVKGIRKVDGIGHSEGCTILQLVARQRDGIIRNLILQAPPGLLGKKSYIELISLEIQHVLHLFIESIGANAEEKLGSKHKRSDLKNWIGGAGLFKSARDGILPGRVEVDMSIDELHKSPENHKISIIAAENDKMINFKEADDLKIGHFYSVEGGHQAFQIKAEECAILAESILKDLENNYSKSQPITISNTYKVGFLTNM
jgi:pimeloyl-ACP methyl ester carboxylesterase